MDKSAHIDGWKAQTEYAAEYTHQGRRWALNFFAVDDDDAKKKLESIRTSATLAGRIELRVPCDE